MVISYNASAAISHLSWLSILTTITWLTIFRNFFLKEYNINSAFIQQKIICVFPINSRIKFANKFAISDYEGCKVDVFVNFCWIKNCSEKQFARKSNWSFIFKWQISKLSFSIKAKEAMELWIDMLLATHAT